MKLSARATGVWLAYFTRSGEHVKRRVAIAILMVASAALIGQTLLAIRRLPTPERVRAHFLSVKVHAIVDRHGQVVDELGSGTRRLNWVRAEELSPAFIDLLNHSKQTLSERLAPLLDSRHRHIATATALELAWRSQDILEAYINLATYRGELQGLAAASQALLDKPARQLTRAEAALLIALIDAPKVTDARVPACQLLRAAGSPEDCVLLTQTHLTALEESYTIRPFIHLAPHLAAHLLRVADVEGNLIRSTLDRDLQWRAMQTLIRHQLRGGAAVILENATGNVLAYASDDSEHDDVLLPRAAETMLAPLIYTQALDEKTLTADTRLAPPNWKQDGDLRYVLNHPSTLAAAEVLDQLGTENFVSTLRTMHFGGLSATDSYGPSLALGTVNVNLLDLANAFRTLANEGQWSPLHFSPDLASETAPARVYTPAAAFIVKSLLATHQKDQWLALYSSGESWSVGFSEKYTLALTGSAEAWHELMAQIQRTSESAAPAVPPGVVRVDGAWFLSGTEAAHKREHSRIAFPQDHTRIDWEDSAVTQPLYFQIADPRSDQNLYLNGRRLGRAQPRLPWEPQTGSFVLELKNADGQLVDRVRFEVHGRRFAVRELISRSSTP
jgi:penicillin-binding protein 1C